MRVSSTEAQYVLSYLISRRRLRPSEVRAALRARQQEIRDLHSRLDALGASGRGADGATRGGAAPAKRRRRLSPRVRALRRQQGRYMSLVRGLKAPDKARVRAAREKRGMGAALKMAATLAKKA